MRERVARLEQAIMEAVEAGLACVGNKSSTIYRRCAGIADISAVTIAAVSWAKYPASAVLGELMGYCGAVPSEDSSGKASSDAEASLRPGNAHSATNRWRSRLELSPSTRHLGMGCADAAGGAFRKRSALRLHGRLNTACTSAI